MDISNLARLVQKAIEDDPPAALAAWCGDQYRPYYHLLHLLALATPHACVELGVEKGRGSFAMCLAGREVYGMDTNRRAEIWIMSQDCPNFHFLEQPSLPPPEQVVRAAPIGLLHVDTEHSYAMAREEFRAYEPLLASGAVVCFDDTHAQESGVGHFVATLGWPTVFDDRLHECGYAVMVYSP